MCVFPDRKKNIPEIISSVRKFPLILTSNVESRMKSLPSAGQETFLSVRDSWVSEVLKE